MRTFDKENPIDFSNLITSGATDITYSVKITNGDYLREDVSTDEYVIRFTDNEFETLRMNIEPNRNSMTVIVIARFNLNGKENGNTEYFEYRLEKDETTLPVIHLTVEPINDGVLSGKDIYVRRRSKLKLTISMDTRYGATVKTCLADIQMRSYGIGEHIIETNALDTDTVISVEGYDSRGFRAASEITIHINDLTLPTIVPVPGETEVRCERSGDKVLLVAGTDHSILREGDTDMNPVSLKYRYRPSNALEFTSYEPITLTDGRYNGFLPFTAANTTSYIVEVCVVDAFDQSSISFTIPTANCVIHANKAKDGIAIGKRCERSGLEVDWDTRFNKSVTFASGHPIADYVIEEGWMDDADYGDSWYVRKWDSGKMEMWMQTPKDTVAITDAWGALYSHSNPIKSSFPLEFAYPPILLASPMSNGYSYFLISGTPVTATGTGDWYYARPTAATINAGISFYAIGAWKVGGE